MDFTTCACASGHLFSLSFAEDKINNSNFDDIFVVYWFEVYVKQVNMTVNYLERHCH